jgi:hypothetical protein
MSSVSVTPPSHHSAGFERAVRAQNEFQNAFATLGVAERLRFLISFQTITIVIFIIGLLSGMYLSFSLVLSRETLFSDTGIVSVALGANSKAPRGAAASTDPSLLFAGEHLAIILIFACFVLCLLALCFVRDARIVDVVERLATMFAGGLGLDALIHILRSPVA